jgi:hypothetical protein
MPLIEETELPQLDDRKACDEWEGATSADSKHGSYTQSCISQQVNTSQCLSRGTTDTARYKLLHRVCPIHQMMPSTCLHCSTLTCLALVLLAFFASLPPRAPVRPYQQNHQLAQDKNARRERVQPSVAQRFLQRDSGLSEHESSDTAEATVHSDSRRGAAWIGIDDVCGRARIYPSEIV